MHVWINLWKLSKYFISSGKLFLYFKYLYCLTLAHNNLNFLSKMFLSSLQWINENLFKSHGQLFNKNLPKTCDQVQTKQLYMRGGANLKKAQAL